MKDKILKTKLKTMTSKHEIEMPAMDQSVSIEMELIPAEIFAKSLAGNTNVAKVQVKGRDFFAVLGKTTSEI